MKCINGSKNSSENVIVQEQPRLLPTEIVNEVSTARVNSQGVAEIINKLVEIRYQKDKFADLLRECPVCCVDFEDNDYITPLPCDTRHFFHRQCISDWLLKHNSCPLCDAPVPRNMQHSYRASVLTSCLIKRNKDSHENGL